MAETPGARDGSLGIAPPVTPDVRLATERSIRGDGSSPNLAQKVLLSMRGGALPTIADSLRRLSRGVDELIDANVSLAARLDLAVARAAGLLGSLNSTVTVANTTAETTIFSTTVPGGTLGSSGFLRFTMAGSVQQASAVSIGAVTWRAYYGTQNFSWTYTFPNTSNAGPNSCEFDGIIFSAGNPGNQRWAFFPGWLNTNGGIDAIAAPSAAQSWFGLGTSAWAVPSGADQIFKLTVAQSTTTMTVKSFLAALEAY